MRVPHPKQQQEHDEPRDLNNIKGVQIIANLFSMAHHLILMIRGVQNGSLTEVADLVSKPYGSLPTYFSLPTK